MAIKKVENDDEYLYLSDFTDQHIKQKVCYVLNYSTGVSKTNKGFYSLFIKTADEKSVTIPAMIFDPKDFIEQGLEIASLKGKFIKVTGNSQVFNGGYSLIVSEITKLESIDRPDAFIGKLNNLDEWFNDLGKMSTEIDSSSPIPLIYKSKSYPSIYSGIIGGYIKFGSTWLLHLMVYFDDYGELLYKVFYNCYIYYSKYLDRLNLLPVVTTMDKLEILKSLPSGNDDVSIITMDSLQAILGIGKPEHLISHIIYENFRLVSSISEKDDLWRSIPKGGVKLLTDSTLRKF